MGIALFAVSGLFSPLQALAHWLMPGVAHPARAGRRPGRRASPSAIKPIADNDRCTWTSAPKASNLRIHRPLRVVRVLEAGRPPADAGRMVISGSMADVCAELDRLAALEATRH
ncbi:hypothetical protein [Variovorax terrae]|uniref:Uncharacterized protein n=1 Tax=Variovorax terrae TaxID=2923278 RepID=A0A9X2AMJ0_9BURK|nr:hypothetical protein [Variovorax terrae]MCJ0763399.1 hypothetical protein [Variovorax terrae]